MGCFGRSTITGRFLQSDLAGDSRERQARTRKKKEPLQAAATQRQAAATWKEAHLATPCR
jgi:hypothetical protein